MDKPAFIYRITGTFGERFNLAIRQILARIAKLKIAKINLHGELPIPVIRSHARDAKLKNANTFKRLIRQI